MTIEKKHGGYVISDIIAGYREHRYYMGYTKREAVRQFKLLTKSITTPNDKRITA